MAASSSSKSPDARARRVVLAFPYGRAFLENVVEGILQHARGKPSWRFARFPERLSPSLEWLRGCQCDGAFVIIATPKDARIARALPFPVVNITAYFARPGVTTITADHEEIGRVAALHLLERRFQNFGYYGSKGLYFSELRREGFARAIREHGADYTLLEASHQVTNGRVWLRQEQELERWLRTLPLPAAIMASTDLRADMLLEACRRLGLRVPEQIAVVGVDNDPIIVSHSQPPLSSVARNDRLAGELAAQRLDELMCGRKKSSDLILVPPVGVIARQSTETIAVSDPEIARLVQHVRERIAEKFGVERLLKLTHWSRRHLENRFQEHLGESPYAFINRMRAEHAERIIKAEPKLNLSEIVAASGFSDLRHLRQVFRRLTGRSPRELGNIDSARKKTAPAGALRS